MNRRRFLAAAAMAAASGGARAQVSGRPRRIGLVLAAAEDDPDARERASAFREGMRALGWAEGRDYTLDIRWGAGDPARAEAHAQALVDSQPDLIVSNGTPPLSALQRRTRTIPIVFVVVTNPVGAGFVRSLARPGANITGFSTYEPEIGGKWFETLREVVPDLRRIGLVADLDLGGFGAVAEKVFAVGAAAGVGVVQIPFRAPNDPLEDRLAAFVSEGGGGLIAMPTAINYASRVRLVDSARRLRLPTIYPFRPFALSGGLMSYGFEPTELFRRSAVYADRILKGGDPGELPVQIPTQFQLVINLSAARAIGLEISPLMLVRADEIIE